MERARDGVPILPAVLAQLDVLAKELGIAPLRTRRVLASDLGKSPPRTSVRGEHQR